MMSATPDELHLPRPLRRPYNSRFLPVLVRARISPQRRVIHRQLARQFSFNYLITETMKI